MSHKKIAVCLENIPADHRHIAYGHKNIAMGHKSLAVGHKNTAVGHKNITVGHKNIAVRHKKKQQWLTKTISWVKKPSLLNTKKLPRVTEICPDINDHVLTCPFFGTKNKYFQLTPTAKAYLSAKSKTKHVLAFVFSIRILIKLIFFPLAKF